jgi:cytochrome P450
MLTCHQRDEAYGQQHGCLPPPLVKNHRPFGVDHLEDIFRANTENRLMQLFTFRFQQTGSTLKQIFLGNPSFSTTDPANLEAIMSTSFKDWSFGARRVITFPMFGDGIFTQEGQAWKHSRQILRPQFQYKQYEDLAVFDDAVDDLLKAITSGIDDNGVIDLQPLFFRFTLDTTTAFLFGESVKSLREPSSAGEESFGEAFNIAQDFIAKRFRLMELYWLIGGKKFRDACKRVNDFADNIIDRNLSRDRTSGGQEKYVFLDTVAENTEDRAALRGQIVNILAAGRDTTAGLLSWTL